MYEWLRLSCSIALCDACVLVLSDFKGMSLSLHSFLWHAGQLTLPVKIGQKHSNKIPWRVIKYMQNSACSSFKIKQMSHMKSSLDTTCNLQGNLDDGDDDE